MLEVCYIEGVRRERLVGGVVVAQDCGLGAFGRVLEKGGGDGRKQLVSRYDEPSVCYGETVFQWSSCEGGIDWRWHGADLP